MPKHRLPTCTDPDILLRHWTSPAFLPTSPLTTTCCSAAGQEQSQQEEKPGGRDPSNPAIQPNSTVNPFG